MTKSLIADAPRLAELNAELVAALERTLLILEDVAAQSPANLAEWHGRCLRGHCPWQDVNDQARAVLAKAAKGRE